MKYSSLKGLDIELSHLGFGCLQLGGYGWGKVSETEMARAVHQAIDSGVTLFDTAPIYGLGHSEEILGKILGAQRKNVILTTKVGLVWKKDKTFEKFTNSSPANINKEIDASLRRLKTDYIDLYQIHWPDPNTSIQDTLFAMDNLKKAGKIRAIGCCNFPLNLLKEALKYSKVQTIQTPYNLIDRGAEKELLPFCDKNSIAVLTYSPIARGLLTGKYNCNTRFGPDDHRSSPTDKYFHGEDFPENLKIAQRVKVIATELNKTPTQIALRWVLENSCVTTAIFGAKTVAQLEENIAASNFVLSKEAIQSLNKVVRNAFN